MSAKEFAAAAREPYMRLLGFLKPYRKRFIIGLACGAVYGLVNGLMVLAVNHITTEVLPKEESKGRNGTSAADAYYPSKELPVVRHALARLKVPAAEAEAAAASYAAFRSEAHDLALQRPPADGPHPLEGLKLHPALPAEFRLLLEGERALLSGPQLEPPSKWEIFLEQITAAKPVPDHLQRARASWQELMALPEEQRTHATLTARYFLARTEAKSEDQSAGFGKLREEARSGKFSDPLNLAEYAPQPKEISVIMSLCLIIPAIMLLRAVFGWLNSYCLTWVSLRVLDDIRTKLFNRVLGQSMDFFHKQKSGDLLQTVVNQTRVAQQALTSVVGEIVKEPISIISALIALLLIDPKFTLMTLLLFPLCIIPVVVIGRKVRKAGNDEESEAGAMSVILQEALSGIREVKSYSREDYESNRFSVSNRKMLQSMMRWRKAMEAVGPLVEVVASVGVAGALVYVYMKGMPAGKFIALNGGLVMLYPPAKALSRIPLMLQKCLAATTKIFELMDREVKVKDPEQPLSLPPGDRGRSIVFEAVDFQYKKDTPVVIDIRLEIPSGSSCALVGRSGAGKSTLFSLLLRFYDPGCGRILMDGTDIRSITQQSLRQEIGVVSQEVFLFHDSIYENIRYGRLDATREEIEEAARRAYAHDFIMASRQGYETVIGDRGSLLSGGQRQRISIARAFLKNAPVLLLDEATSSLDSESESLIQKAIHELSEGKTMLVIAHRLSTVINSNIIVVMDHGRIVDAGPHAELIARCALYQQLHAMNFDTGELPSAEAA